MSKERNWMDLQESDVLFIGAALHVATERGSYRIDHWDDAMAQGAHVARTILCDFGGEDPGPYRPIAGFAMNIYGVAVTGFGIAKPGAAPRSAAVAGGGLVSRFILPDGPITGAVEWAVGRDIHTLRQELLPHL